MNNESEFDYINTFPPLGHPEHHFNKYPNHRWIKNKDVLKQWVLKNVKIGFEQRNPIKESDFYIDDDFYFNYIKSGHENDRNKGINFIVVTKSIRGNLPLQFLKVNDFIASNIGLRTMVGTPFVINYLDVENNRLKDFYGLSASIDDGLMIADNPLISFKGMPQFKNNKKLYLYMGLVYLEPEKKSLFNFRKKEPALTSWDYFTNVKLMMFWQSKWCDKTSYDLILNLPESVDELLVTHKLLNDDISPLFKNSDMDDKMGFIKELDMDWLKEERLKLKIEKANDLIIKTVGADTKLKERRRKI